MGFAGGGGFGLDHAGCAAASRANAASPVEAVNAGLRSLFENGETFENSSPALRDGCASRREIDHRFS
jgi:hypothetical protein